MQSNELRKGNYLKWQDESNDIVIIDSIISEKDGQDSVTYHTLTNKKQSSCKLFEFEPIRLTEEWLLKFGFKKSPANNSYFFSIPLVKGEIHFEKYAKEYVCVIYCSTGAFIPHDIKYIHQIQNLFQALTGEELTLNDKKCVLK